MLSALAICFALMSAPANPSDEARALFEDGQAKYETHDYVGAVDAFTAAFAKAEQIEDTELRDEALARLAFNLARAHASAYDIDHDGEHLTLARRLIADFRGHERALGRDPDADTDLQRLEAELTERERQRDEATGGGISPEQAKRNRKKRIAGISMMVLAVPFGGLAATGAILGTRATSDWETGTTGAERQHARSMGHTGDILLGVGIGLAVVSAATGATLLGLSAKGKRAQVSARATLGGFVLEGKF